MVKIYVGNLSKSARREDLQSLFAKYGKVVECDILREFGFVHMDDVHEAEQAVKALHGYQFSGSSLRVEISTGGSKRDSRPAPRDRDRERDRSPLRNRDRGSGGDYFSRDRDGYDSYGRGGYAPPPPPPSNSSSFYAMLASAAANVHNQLVHSRISDPQEVYHRMYLAISNAASQPPPLVGGGSGSGFDRPSPQYSGSRYGSEPYGGGSGGGYRSDSYDRRRF